MPPIIFLQPKIYSLKQQIMHALNSTGNRFQFLWYV
jgi:hypothetical protein